MWDAWPSVLLIYLLISMVGESALLDFTLRFPRPWKVAGSRRAVVTLYGPVVLAGAIATVALVIPRETAERLGLLTIFVVLETMVVNLFALLAILVIATRFARASAGERRATGLGVMLAGSLLALLPWLGALAAEGAGLRVPGGAQLYTLLFVLSPASIAWAVVHEATTTAG